MRRWTIAASIGAFLFCAARATGFPASFGTGSFLGIDVVERPEGLMVWRVMPGPLDGNFVASATLARGDLLLEINGAPATLAAWNAMLAQPAGTAVSISYREGQPRGSNGKPRVEGPSRELQLVTDDAVAWKGLTKSGEQPPYRRPPVAPAAATDDLPAALAMLGPEARARTERLLASLDGIAGRHGDPRTPMLLRAIFHEPASTESFVRAAIPAASRFTESPFRGAAELVAGLATATGDLPAAHGSFTIDRPQAAIWYLDFLLNGARARFDEWVRAEDRALPGLRPLVVERLDDLLVSGPHARDAMAALRALPTLDAAKAAALLAHFDVVPAFGDGLASAAAEPIPDALRAAVEGTILAAEEIPELGWLVVGGTGANRYDLGVVAAVLDLGGNDRYEWNQTQGQHRLVVDRAGDDLHSGGALGPAGALGAIAVIDDHAGNDRYEGGALTAGSALGLSAIIDRAGDDHYRAGAWSLGAAAGGASVVVDLAGCDRIEAEGMAIGVGGPVAVGAFVDVDGHDIASLGTRPSVYGVAGEHAGFGMGFGLGFRLAAAGGVGAYIDFAGRDQRRSGEFSQGCGYYLGLGILFDGAGDDLSACDRYGFGSAAHQAAGVMIDLDGNDTIVAKTAAHVGGAWDESLAYFIDHRGDDSYRVDGLSLGAAAQQAVGIAIDRAGSDLYRAGGTCLGAVSDNEYHFDEAGLGSFALFLDAGGVDLYPSVRGNGTRRTSPEDAGVRARERDSVFEDRPDAAP